MSAYAEIVDGFCVNAVEAEPDFAEANGLPSIPDGYWIGDYFDGSAWYHEKPPTDAQLVEQRTMDMHLDALPQGRQNTDLGLAPIARGQYTTQKELEAMQSV